jgi:hypothetical protein
MDTLANIRNHESWSSLAQALLNSYRQWTGQELIQRTTPEADLQTLWETPRVVVSHGTQSDPVFEYGNRLALELWELPLHDFLGMPSRKTAEPVHQDDRRRLLERTRQHGFVDDYRGVRISRTGKRFMIQNALLWTVLNRDGKAIGQAATFDRWTFLDALESAQALKSHETPTQA